MGIIINQGSKNTVILYAGAVIGACNTILLYPNIMPPEEFGLLTTITSLCVLLASVGSLGTTISVVRFLPYYRDSSTGEDKGLLRFVLQIGLFASVLIAFLLLLGKGVFEKPFQNSATLIVDYYYYIIPFFIAHLFLEIFASYTNALYKTSFQLFVREILLRIGQTLMLSLYFLKVLDVQTFLLCYILLYVFSFSVLIYNLKANHKINFLSRITITSSEKKEIFRFGGYSFLSSFSRTLSFRIDAIMLSILVVSDVFLNQGLKATAIYAVALNMAVAIEMPFRGINQIINPTIATAWKEKNLSQIKDVYSKSTDTMVVICGFLFIVIWASIDEILTILPEKYEMAKYTFFWLGLGKFINAASGSNGNILINSEKYKIYTVVSVVGLLLTILTNYLLIPILQVEGAALATFITYFLINFSLWLAIKNHFKMQPFNLKNIIVVAVLIGLYSVTLMFNIDHALLSLIAKSAFLGGTFALIVLSFNLSPDIKTFISDIRKKRK